MNDFTPSPVPGCTPCGNRTDGRPCGRHTMGTPEQRFTRNITAAPSGCWEWTAGRNREQYGVFTIGHTGRSLAHRYAWELYRGAIPEGMFVLHNCDNPPCVNPAHLRIGSHEENMRDMVERGRHWRMASTHCDSGHEYTPENTKFRPDRRVCRECQRAWRRAMYARKLASQ